MQLLSPNTFIQYQQSYFINKIIILNKQKNYIREVISYQENGAAEGKKTVAEAAVANLCEIPQGLCFCDRGGSVFITQT